MTRILRTSILTALLAAGAACALPVQAALFSDDEARKAILDLRAEMRSRLNALQSEISAKQDKANTLDLHNQNEQLRQEIARLRGQIEVLTNELANEQKRQKDFYVDLDARLRKLEPQKVTIDGKEFIVEQAEQRAYDAALAAFREGNYRHAGAAFYDFTRRYPNSGMTPNAQYWLGNAYYAQRDYRNAIAAHEVVVSKYPDSPKAPDALLNIASCHIELKDRAAARNTLDTLIANYPDSPAAQTARERLAALR